MAKIVKKREGEKQVRRFQLKEKKKEVRHSEKKRERKRREKRERKRESFCKGGSNGFRDCQ